MSSTEVRPIKLMAIRVHEGRILASFVVEREKLEYLDAEIPVKILGSIMSGLAQAASTLLLQK